MEINIKKSTNLKFLKKIIGIFLFVFFFNLLNLYLSIEAVAQENLPVFPGAIGFGTDTRGAFGAPNGFIICKVNTLSGSRTAPALNEDGTYSGNFCGCLAHNPGSGKGKLILFEVSGTIDLRSSKLRDGDHVGEIRLNTSQNYITVAGQSAPPPGILFKGATFSSEGDHIVFQHIRIRVGDDIVGLPGYLRRGLVLRGDYNVADHCSISWALDQNAGGSGDNVTFSNCIISEGLVNPLDNEIDCPNPENRTNHLSGGSDPHDEAEHSCGFLVESAGGPLTIYGSLFAHNKTRNPLIGHSDNDLFMVNNLVYNWTDHAMLYGRNDGDDLTWDALISGNKFIDFGGYLNGGVAIQINSSSRAYINNNSCPANSHHNISELPCVFDKNSRGLADIFVDFENLEPHFKEVYQKCKARPLDEIEAWIKSSAGAFPLYRDSVDERIIGGLENRTGSFINCPDQAGGWPVLKNNTKSLILPVNYNSDDDNNGYSNLEEWLHAFSCAVEGSNSSSCEELKIPSEPVGLSVR